MVSSFKSEGQNTHNKLPFMDIPIIEIWQTLAKKNWEFWGFCFKFFNGKILIFGNFCIMIVHFIHTIADIQKIQFQEKSVQFLTNASLQRIWLFKINFLPYSKHIEESIQGKKTIFSSNYLGYRLKAKKNWTGISRENLTVILVLFIFHSHFPIGGTFSY